MIKKYRTTFAHPFRDLKELINVNDPTDTVVADFDQFEEGEIVFSDHIKIHGTLIEEDMIFITVPMAYKQ